ncbi:TolC family protein [Spirosoma sordidisoli]|uniref:TolC family protein n=1 Tax=Spirosoma sordidisoli TaxID=2502893 RepID=A0A4Q2UMS6_9BACT|nr:TolC family protein [Spirosoma sordidisoli]RYC68069.1 TolC family protein [Spirosoma sordidisoli]
MNTRRMRFLRIGVMGCCFGWSALTSLAQSTTNPPAAVSPATGDAAIAPSQQLSLQQCIEIALKNNITVRQSQLQVNNSNVQLQQSKLNRLPNLNGFATQNFSSGFNVNPVTNQFVERSILSNNFQLTSSVTVYNGGILQNTIRQNALLVQSNEQNLLATQNNVILLVVQNYLNVLTGQEQLAIAQRQADVSRSQYERTQKLVNAGAAAESALFDLQAQRATDELAIVNAQNNIDLAKVALLQAMNLFGNQAISVQPVSLPDPNVADYDASPQQVYEIATNNMPDVRAADLRVRSDEVGVRVARGNYMPLLTLNGGVTTLYSNFGAQRRIENGVTQIPQTITINGIQQTILIDQPNYSFENFNFAEQFKNNQNRSLGLTLQVPIFNRYQARTRVQLATINRQNSELQADNTRLALRQNIENAYANLVASGNRYRATLTQVTAFEQAFRASENRFNAGAINAVDYNIAKSNLDRARASLVQAKYDYVFRTKILDFYQNKPLTF